MAASPMQPLGRLGRFRFYWASPRLWFSHPGLYVWTGKRHRRLLPLRRRRYA